MNYSEIIFQTAPLSVSGEAVGSTSSGALAASLANAPVVPGSVSLSDGTNTFTDSNGSAAQIATGVGVLTGSPAGSGTINYGTGAFSITGGATTHAVTATYKHWNSVISVVNENDGNTSAGGSFSGNTVNGNLVPGSVTISDGTNTFTDATGSGTLSGNPAGSGTINYSTGAITLSGAAASHAVSVTYQYTPNYGNPVGLPIPLPNSVKPMNAQIRNESTALSIVIQVSENPNTATPAWRTIYAGQLAAWANPAIGYIDNSNIKIYAVTNGTPVPAGNSYPGTARLTGVMANAQ